MRKVLNLSFALALVAGLFAGSLASVGAASPSYGPQNPGQNQLAFPFVHNKTAIGSQTFTGSVTIQNLEVFPVSVSIASSGGTTTATLNPRASKSFSASTLKVPDGGGPVIATASWTSTALADMANLGFCASGTTTDTVTRGPDGTSTDTFTPSATPLVGGSFTVTTTADANSTVYTGASVSYDPATGIATVTWDSEAGSVPNAGQTYYVHYTSVGTDCGTPAIGGVEKHEADNGGTVVTGSNQDTVDGSNAVPESDAAFAAGMDPSQFAAELNLNHQSRWILPIVQTNTGWDSILHVSNVSGHGNVGVQVLYYNGGGQGVAGQSMSVLNTNLGAMSTATVDLGTLLPAGSVGSVWIDADDTVVASVDRVKASTMMALTNVAQPRLDNSMNFLRIFGINPTTKYAPLIFRDYNNWNTGINIANLSSNTNQVTVTYYNYSDNSVAQETVNIPPRAMEYVYRPGTGDAGLSVGQISAATIVGSDPIAVAVDEVKYAGNAAATQGVGQAMSYLATEGALAGPAYDTGQFPALANLFHTGRVMFRNDLSLPIVQKGSMDSGNGDFSGINLFNGDPNNAVQAWVQFEDVAGIPVAPTTGANERELPLKLSLPALGSATVYTANYSEMPNGFVGSAVVGAVYTNAGQVITNPSVGPLTAVSNNVNYAVTHDGSAVYNLYPYWHLLPPLAPGCFYPGFVGGGICIP